MSLKTGVPVAQFEFQTSCETAKERADKTANSWGFFGLGKTGELQCIRMNGVVINAVPRSR
jgi:hypothetical protein